MFCLLITTFIGVQVIAQEQTRDCYATHAECERDAPRVAHKVIPVGAGPFSAETGHQKFQKGPLGLKRASTFRFLGGDMGFGV